MRPEYRKCPLCGTVYYWNPDVGKFRCPACMGFGFLVHKKKKEKLKNKLKKIFGGGEADIWR